MPWRGAMLLAVALGLSLVGCAAHDLKAMADALNARHVSNCLFVQGAFAPYGSAVLYAKTGNLDCLALWKWRMRLSP